MQVYLVQTMLPMTLTKWIVFRLLQEVMSHAISLLLHWFIFCDSEYTLAQTHHQ